VFKFSEAVSFQVFCNTQEEVDHYWNRLSENGEEGRCGWLKDKYGVSWQIIPVLLPELLKDPERSGRVTRAFLQMKKLDITGLLKA
jgi:predicted 3-demethylubiquinone-9 3-methyltransferase (glyoxalase superfamily)